MVWHRVDEWSERIGSGKIQSQRLDHLGSVAGICNEIELIEVVDAHIGKVCTTEQGIGLSVRR